MRPSHRRAAAIAGVLAVLLFGGSHVARCVVDGLAAPLAGLERLAQRPSNLPPTADPLPDWEESNEPMMAAEGHAQTRAMGHATRFQAQANAPAFGDQMQIELKIGPEELVFFAISVPELSVDNLAQLEKDYNLTPLQRERIERWLVRKQEALDALGDKKDPNKIQEIEESTAAAVRAELDFFQGQEFDRRRESGVAQASFFSLAVSDALTRDRMTSQQSPTTDWVKVLDSAWDVIEADPQVWVDSITIVDADVSEPLLDNLRKKTGSPAK